MTRQHGLRTMFTLLALTAMLHSIGSAAPSATLDTRAVVDVPVANDDSYDTDEDTGVVISAPGVLENDTDIDDDTLTAFLVSGPAHGTVFLNPDGSFTYNPDADYFGPDSFTYKANDGLADSNFATVMLYMNPVNDAPVAYDNTYSSDEDNMLVMGVLENDTDIEYDLLTAVLVSDPTHGLLFLNPDGTISYTPDSNFNGTDSFTYKASDGQADSNVVTVNINVNAVNDEPVANDDNFFAQEDSPLFTGPGILMNDTDIENNFLFTILVSAPVHGFMNLNPDGSFSYIPDANYNGMDSFTYKVNDGQSDSNIATVIITVLPVNDAPVANDDFFMVDEDNVLFIGSPGLAMNDFDIDSGLLMPILMSGTTHGILIVNPDGSFMYQPYANYNGMDSFVYKVSDGQMDSNFASVNIIVNAVNDAPVANNDSYAVNEDGALIFAPSVLNNDFDIENNMLMANVMNSPAHGFVALNPDGSFLYIPDANFNGTDSFTYNVFDGQSPSNIAMVSIDVFPVNDAPVATNDSFMMDEDATLMISAPGVVDNDLDADNDTLLTQVVSGTTNGILTFNTDGSFTYTPNSHFFGTDNFTYKVNDGQTDSNTATVTIAVNDVNLPPEASDNSYFVTEDDSLTITAPGVLDNDTDDDNAVLTSNLVNGAAHGSLTFNADGSFIYTPNGDYFGTDSFTYTANDGQSDSNIATVTITVNGVNDCPVTGDLAVVTSQEQTTTIVLLVSDADNDPLTSGIVTPPSDGTAIVNPDGTISYTPDVGFHGTDMFTYDANDGVCSSSIAGIVSITVLENQCPAIASDTTSTAEETAIDIAVLANDADPDAGDTLTPAIDSGPANGSAVVNPDGTIRYTPNADFFGDDGFTYTVTDGICVAGAVSVSITVTNTNDCPVPSADAASTNEDVPVDIDVLDNDDDADGTTPVPSVAAQPSHGTATINPNGTIHYSPDSNYFGPDSFTYALSDESCESGSVLVSVIVDSLNDAPIATDDFYSVRTSSTLTANAPGVLANDTDAESQTLTAAVESGPSSGSLTLNPDGSFEYTPAPGYAGPDSFMYRASDGISSSSIAGIVSITVLPNECPVLAADTTSTAEETEIDIAVLANDADPDAGDTLTPSIDSVPANGSAAVNLDGTIRYTPNADFFGDDSFTYTVTDGICVAGAVSVSITVTNTNDCPVPSADAASTNEDVPTDIDVLANDDDADGTTPVPSIATQPSHGAATVNPNGTIHYSPEANYFGSDSFTYALSDESCESSAVLVSITVDSLNDAPIGTDDFYSVLTSDTLTVGASGVLANDTDAESQTLTAAIESGPSSGSLTLNPDGSFEYTPAPGYTGPDSFTYRASDGDLQSDVTTVSILVEEPCFLFVQHPPGDCATLPDVTVEFDEAPVTLLNKKGGRIRAKMLITNLGGALADGVTVQAYLSDDDCVDESDLPLLKKIKLLKVKPEASRKLALKSMTFPLGALPYGKRVIVVLDRAHAVAECDENNNYEMTDPLPAP